MLLDASRRLEHFRFLPCAGVLRLGNFGDPTHRSVQMAAFSLDLRHRVLADCHAGLTYAAIARKYTTSAEWVRLFHKRFQETGEIAARSHAANRTPFHARHEPALRAAVAAKPDRTLEDLRAHLGLEVSIGTLWSALRALKISFKKTRLANLAG